MAVVHGGDRRAAAEAWGCHVDDILDLSTGVPPEPDPKRLAHLLSELAPKVSAYPDRDGEPARTALAKALEVDPESLLLASGAQAFVEVIYQAFSWKSVAIREPSYGEVRRCAERAGVEVRASASNEPWRSAQSTWVTDPDGYSGVASVPPAEGPGVIDESYATLAVRQRGLMPGWIRIGSLTKCFSMPGLRLGYAVADPGAIETLRTWLPPWPASTLSLHLLPELLEDWERRDHSSAQDRQRLCALLEGADWELAPGHASFVLAKPRGFAPDFAAHKILVREFPEWPTLEGWVRFGIPAEAAWSRLENALCP